MSLDYNSQVPPLNQDHITWDKTKPLRDVARRYEDRVNRASGSFKQTVTFNEQQIIRKAIRYSDKIKIRKNERAGLMAFVNLWFWHRSRGIFYPGHAKLMKKLRVSANTLRSVLRWMKSLGFIQAIGGGHGKADRIGYKVDLVKIMAVLAPNMALEYGSESISTDGEIEQILGCKNEGPIYIYSKRVHQKQSRARVRSWFERFAITGFHSQTFMLGILDRLTGRSHYSKHPDCLNRCSGSMA